METLALLDKLAVQCEHSGTYVDPITAKMRQFDIRGELRVGKLGKLWLAVECKNVGDSCPVVVHTVPRNESESFVTGLVYKRPPGNLSGRMDPSFVRLSGLDTPYQVGESVGKAFDQVKLSPSGEPSIGESEAFDKFSQAVNSLRDLIVRGTRQWNEPSFQFFLPVLVVPEGRLWAVRYNEHGGRVGLPAQAVHVSHFLNHSWPCGFADLEYPVSHLEIVTPSGLRTLVEGAQTTSPHFWALSKHIPELS